MKIFSPLDPKCIKCSSYEAPSTACCGNYYHFFHSCESSPKFSKYLFLNIHIDSGLFTQVHQAPQRVATVLCC